MSGTLNATLNSTPAGQAAAVNFNIPYIVPPNTPPNLAPYLQPIYSDFQNLIQTLILNAGISARTPAQMLTSKDDPTAYLAANTHRFYTQALEPIVYGAPISLVSIGNITYVRNAWAKDTTLPPHGFCSNSGGIKSGSIGEVCIGDGMIVNTFNNLTVGSIYYVSNNAGNYSATPGTNNYPVGYAITSTSLLFRAFNGLDGPPKQDTYLLATQYYTEAPGSSSIFNRAPPPTPLSTLSNMTVGDKDKLKNIFNFGEVWAPDQNYECSAKLQSFLLYCQMMALAQKNLSGDNNCYRQYVTCYIPRGQYLLGSPVVIPELVKVDGPGIFERVGYLGAQSGVLTNGLFYATSTSGQPGCYRPMMICVPRAHIGLLNLYTGNTNYYFRGPGLVIGKYWSIDTTSIVNIGNAGSGYAVNDTITAVNPSVSPYFGCTVKVTSVTTGGAITGLTATNCGAYGLPPNLQIQQWTTANGFNVFDPANPGYFIQGSTSGSGSGCSFLPTWCSEFAGGNYNFGAYHQGSPLQTDTIVEHVNITGSMPGTIDSTYGPQYCVMVTGLNGIIHEIEGIGGHIGCYFLFANDYRVTHLNFVLSGIFCQIYSCGSIEIVDPIPDTCGCQLMIDQSGRIKATLMQFVEEANLPGGPVYPNTQGYAICIGSSSSATYCNQHLDIKFMLVNSGAVTSATLTEYPNLATIGNIVKPQNASIYLAYVKDSNIEGVVGNWDETGQYTSYLPATAFVYFGPGVDASVRIRGSISLISGPACVGAVSTSPCDIEIWDSQANGYASIYGTYQLFGTAAPTSTTGQGKAAVGSSYLNTANGNLYYNTGTISSPTWTLIGSGSGGSSGVSSFNSRTGSVTPASGDYSFSLISGSLASSQLPSSGVTAGSYTLSNITVDSYGRITAASSGSAAVTSVNGNTGAITGLATTASPAFTGTPTAPTAPTGTNTTQLATTAFVISELGIAGGIPGGSSGQLQYNNAGAFGGISYATVTSNLTAFAGSSQGVVPVSSGGTTSFLRADGNWASPSISLPNKSGRFYGPSAGTLSTCNQFSTSSSTYITAFPIYIQGGLPIVSFSIEITTGVTSTFTWSAALYADNGGTPVGGAKIQTTGTATVAASSTGVQTQTISSGATPADGWYWLCLCVSYNASGPVFKAINAGSAGQMQALMGYTLTAGSASGNPDVGYSVGGATVGTWTSTFSTGATAVNSNLPAVWLGF